MDLKTLRLLQESKFIWNSRLKELYLAGDPEYNQIKSSLCRIKQRIIAEMARNLDLEISQSQGLDLHNSEMITD